ncbi:MAG: ATP-binding cassette domain-containing protein [Prevotella sp.]|jgi:ABC-type bacteriocin/lantibiotic exporter with double-glycine peptidase domain|nr:ATP-binding cassette domain-containing protein [Prevotella sp.]
MKQQQQSKKSGLSMVSAFHYFLKGNMLFAFNGIVIVAIDSVACIFPPLFQKVYTDNIITQKNPEWFTPLIVLYILLFVIELLVWIGLSIVRRKSQARINITTSSNFLWTVLRLPMTRLTQFSPGELAARYTTISKTTRQMDYVLPALSILILPVLCCYIVMQFNWKLGLLEIFSILFLVYVMRSTANKQKKIAMNLEVTEARLQNVTMTGMSNLETIKALGGERHFFAQWERTYAQSLNARVTTITHNIYLSALPEFVLQVTDGVILCLGTWLILQGEMTPGMILASQGLINETIYPIIRAIASVQTALRVNSSIQRIKEVTDYNKECTDLCLPADDELPDVAKLAGEIELRDVTFGYDRSLPPIIEHFSLKIKAGERIALVGPSGCGKSTILSLVSGLYEPWEGEVLFDGKPRKAIDRMTFVNSVSVVNQDVTLFEGTIADNVKMWDESIEDFAMVVACNNAQIHQEIMERPGAYQGVVSERGKNFSGGQRQRIEIATALAKEPTILLMDEGTSALDSATESKVMQHLYHEGMTMIIIAHRLETIAQCEQIYVIEHGRITQHGTHDELRQMDGLYSNLLKFA